MRFVDRFGRDGDETFDARVVSKNVGGGVVSVFRVASRSRSADRFGSGSDAFASAAATSDSGDSATLSHRIGCGVMDPAGRSSREAVGGRFSASSPSRGVRASSESEAAAEAAAAASLDLRVGL